MSEDGRIKQLEEQSKLLCGLIESLGRSVLANTEAIRTLAVQVKQNPTLTSSKGVD